MQFTIGEQSKIEDPRKYGKDIINELRGLLIAGKQAQCDPRRQHFYELSSNRHTFYIHVSPVNRDVVLLARWPTRPAGSTEETAASSNEIDEILAAPCH
jgi:hypothetical protein